MHEDEEFQNFRGRHLYHVPLSRRRRNLSLRSERRAQRPLGAILIIPAAYIRRNVFVFVMMYVSRSADREWFTFHRLRLRNDFIPTD